MGGLIANAVISVVVGCALWALLPRGVVLTRRLKVLTEQNAEPQTWELRNEGPLPIRITRVTYSGIRTYDASADRVESRVLPTENDRAQLGVDLTFDDEILEVGRDAHSTPWKKVVVPPGDTLTAFVDLNCSLSLRYRRSGPFGILERRRLNIDGGV